MSPEPSTPISFIRVLIPVLALTLLALGALASLYAVAPEGGIVTRVQAQALDGNTIADVDPDAWQAFSTLRRFSKLPGGNPSQYGAMRFELDLQQPPAEPLAIYIPAYDSSLTAWLNGHYLGEAGSVEPPIAVNAYHPALFPLRSEYLKPGRNEIVLIVAQAISGGGIVHIIHVGPSHQLERAWAWTTFASVDILGIYNGLFLVLGAFALYVYLQLRRESVFLWFVLLIAFCGLRNVDILWTQWPETQQVRALLVYGSSLGILLSCSGFVNRLMDRHAALDRWLLLAMPPLLLLFWWRSSSDLMAAIDEGYAILRIVFALVAPLMLWRLAAVARRLPSWRSGWMLGCLCMAVVFVSHDVVMMWLTSALNYQYSLLASLPMISAFVVAVAQRYVESAREIERSHATLERRVEETEHKLLQSHEQLRVMERQQVLANERQRIMRDMHDGVGGQLTSLVLSLRHAERAPAEVAREIEQSLTDLRLIIDSLDDVVAADLRTALGMFRQRIAPWLQQHGISLDWQMMLPPLGGYGPRETLHLFRILQEACSNVVRHSGAGRVSIAASLQDSALPLRIEVADNGRGAEGSSEPRAGRGRRNMAHRAEQMGGVAEVEFTRAGTVVRLDLPRPAPTHESA